MADTDSDETSRRPWLFALALLAGVAIVALLLWLVPFGTAIISGANRNNQRDLQITASGLEHWSRAIPDVARGAFVHGRVTPIKESERDYRDGWRYRALQHHPNLGGYRIVYTINTEADCAALRGRITHNEGRLPFVASYVTGSGAQLKVVDSFALDDIYALDTGRAIGGSADVAGYVAGIGGISGAVAVPSAGPYVVCYAIVIPLEKLLVLSESATRRVC